MKGILLCVDDEAIILNALKDQLRKAYGRNYQIEVAESAEEGLEILDEFADQGLTPLVVISDWLMPGMRGDEFLIAAHGRYPNVIKVLLSGQADADAVTRVRDQAQLHEFIGKPWDAEVLIQSIDAGLAKLAARNPA
jgi:DNA-binding NtrC family response regulator